jgi:hypothetical protein
MLTKEELASFVHALGLYSRDAHDNTVNYETKQYLLQNYRTNVGDFIATLPRDMQLEMLDDLVLKITRAHGYKPELKEKK